MWMHGSHGGGFFLVFPAIFLIVLLLWLALRVGRRGFRGGCSGLHGRPMRRQSQSHGAKELLDQRYARGDIDHEQYLKMKQALNQRSSDHDDPPAAAAALPPSWNRA